MPARIDYNPQNVRELSDAQLRKAYSEVRSIARKRVERMAKSEFADTDIANRSFPAVRQVKAEDLRNALLDVSQFVRDPRTSLTYHRRIITKTINTLESHGYSIPRDNLKEFGDFMEFIRDRWKGRKLPPSDLPAQMFENISRRNINIKTFMKEYEQYLETETGIEDALLISERVKVGNYPTQEAIEAAKARGMSLKTILREFKGYFKDETETRKFINTINSMPENKRVTSRQLRNKLGIK